LKLTQLRLLAYLFEKIPNTKSKYHATYKHKDAAKQQTEQHVIPDREAGYGRAN
jgi:hypothetical protein